MNIWRLFYLDGDIFYPKSERLDVNALMILALYNTPNKGAGLIKCVIYSGKNLNDMFSEIFFCFP